MEVFGKLCGIKGRTAFPTPYIPSAAPYDNGSFDEYPVRAGFQLSRNGLRFEAERDIEGSPDEPRLYANQTGFLQSWLFFGLIDTLTSYVGVAFRSKEMVVEKAPGQFVVDLASLGEALVEWEQSVGQMLQGEDWAKYLENIMSPLKIAHRNAVLHDFDVSNTKEHTIVSRERAAVILGIKCCVRAFFRPLYLIGKVRKNVTPLEQRLVIVQGCGYISPSASLAREFLTSNGWCPVLAERLIQSEDIENIFDAGVRRSDFPRRPDDLQLHTKCNFDEGCIAANTGGEGFEALHTEPDCQCSVVVPDMDLVERIIAAGGIPLIEVCGIEGDDPSLKVSKANADSNYTAVSHVWSDGLADPKRNGLLKCQLQKLTQETKNIQRILKDQWRKDGIIEQFISITEFISGHLRKPSRLWVDALCIPCFDPERAEQVLLLKRMAIRQMPLIYAAAAQVLVLDKGLESIEFAPEKNSSARIHPWLRSSSWMTRCWTLPEGALARKLFFRTKQTLEEEMQQFIEQLVPDRGDEFAGNLRNLMSRDTSQMDDIHQILAHLCNFDASELSDIAPQLRLKAILHSNAPDFPFSLMLQQTPLSFGSSSGDDDIWIPPLESRVCLDYPSSGREGELPPYLEIIVARVCRLALTVVREGGELPRLVIRRETSEDSTKHEECLDSGILPVFRFIRRYIASLSSGSAMVAFDLYRTRSIEKNKAKKQAALQSAVLHDEGIIFNVSSLGFVAVRVTSEIHQKVRIRCADLTYWLLLDIWSVPNGTSKDNTEDQPAPAVWWFILPSIDVPLNAAGLLGRGLCLKQRECDKKVGIPNAILKHYSAPRQWSVISTGFMSALTCGVVTSMTDATIQHLPVVSGEAEPGPHSKDKDKTLNICVSAAVKSWPLLAPAREAGEHYGSRHSRSADGIMASSLVSMGAFVAITLPLVIILSVKLNLSLSKKTAMVFTYLAVLVSSCLWMLMRTETYMRRRAWSRWAQTFRETTSKERERARARAKWRLVFVLWRHFSEMRFWFGL